MANNSVTKFRQKAKKDLRADIDGTRLIADLQHNLKALSKIDEELEQAIQEFERDVLDNDGNLIRTERYKSTLLDKETIAVYHTRQAGRKMQIDTTLRLLNKVLPDLKAVEKTKDLNNRSEQALLAFAKAASSE
jgi:hypothetical protein